MKLQKLAARIELHFDSGVITTLDVTPAAVSCDVDGIGEVLAAKVDGVLAKLDASKSKADELSKIIAAAKAARVAEVRKPEPTPTKRPAPRRKAK